MGGSFNILVAPVLDKVNLTPFDSIFNQFVVIGILHYLFEGCIKAKNLPLGCAAFTESEVVGGIQSL